MRKLFPGMRHRHGETVSLLLVCPIIPNTFLLLPPKPISGSGTVIMFAKWREKFKTAGPKALEMIGSLSFLNGHV